jgi:flavin reductase (DIM6/NTAB) family NADH-FMN oxidoreductase RutF
VREPSHAAVRRLDPRALSGVARYRLLTSLVVPRPIGWISTRSPDGTANLAPFSYFGALSSSPMQVGVSIGHRRASDGGPRRPKDTLANVRSRAAFCVNVVGEPLLEAMNASSAEVGPEVDEFALAGLEAAGSEVVDAPFVVGAPAVLECRVVQEVALGAAPNTLVIGEVVGVRLDPSLDTGEDGWSVEPEALRPVGRLDGARYALLREVRSLPRP